MIFPILKNHLNFGYWKMSFGRKFRLKGVVTQVEPYGEIYQTIGQCILSNCNPAANKQYVNKVRGEQTCLYQEV